MVTLHPGLEMRNGVRFRWCLLGVALLASSRVQGQTGSAPVSVRGVAFDGLRGHPLPNALITMAGSRRNTTTDERGRFEFDSVSPGVHAFSMQHAALDSIGFNGLTTRTMVTDGHTEIRISVPSFASLWRVACGNRAPPSDSGFVYGSIRGADGERPVPNATVDVSWAAVVMSSTNKVIERRWHTTTISDSTGSYSVCGVAANEWLEVRATADSTASGWVTMPPSTARVQRRDLLVGPSGVADTLRRGTITGLITDSFGLPYSEARVHVEGAAEVRSGSDGRFTLSNVPTGTRMVDVSTIGIVPVTAIVDVAVKDTETVALQFGPPVALKGVRTVAARSGHVLAAEFDSRRRVGAGFTMDSIKIAAFPRFYDALKMGPSTQVEYYKGFLRITLPSDRGGTCEPDIRIDGEIAGFGHLIDLQPDEVAGFEVYARPLFIPPLYITGPNMPTCGMILVWTKYGFRNR
jgi:hypothetical protein